MVKDYDPETGYAIVEQRNKMVIGDKIEVFGPGADFFEQELTFEKIDNPFAFSCLPYTASEIENATHHEELPPARRTVLCVYGAVRGVGGIDSWGSDVEDAYHINAEEDITYSFVIC